jgi:hypothetical protein
MEMSGEFYALAASLPEKKNWYRLNWRLGGPRAVLGVNEKGKITCPLLGLKLRTANPVGLAILKSIALHFR